MDFNSAIREERRRREEVERAALDLGLDPQTLPPGWTPPLPLPKQNTELPPVDTTPGPSLAGVKRSGPLPAGAKARKIHRSVRYHTVLLHKRLTWPIRRLYRHYKLHQPRIEKASVVSTSAANKLRRPYNRTQPVTMWYVQKIHSVRLVLTFPQGSNGQSFTMGDHGGNADLGSGDSGAEVDMEPEAKDEESSGIETESWHSQMYSSSAEEYAPPREDDQDMLDGASTPTQVSRVVVQ